MREPEFREFYRNEASTAGTDSGIKEPVHNIAASTTPEEKIDAAYASQTGDLRDELLERILENRPAFFEQLIIDLLVTMGYGGNHKNAAAQFGRSGDGSVDAIINVDRFGLDRICVQAKRYAPANQVGRPNVNGFVGRLVGLGASKGIFVTTSTFSQPAQLPVVFGQTGSVGRIGRSDRSLRIGVT
ncbi:restriction endonuclease [Devosia sp.]|uniref:restriction endonuclease n=1 Tax=Devosia sp. TaxID=1871048 RepID=UPI0027373696|nr:restriction endonuclease [Devosia sp.]MDP2779123.1 restriction endonuclease [Devosia sp.]